MIGDESGRDGGSGGGKPRVFTVTSLTRLIRGLLEDEVGSVWVEGEVSRPVQPASGHLYLTLKDKDSQLKAVVFKNRLAYMAFPARGGDLGPGLWPAHRLRTPGRVSARRGAPGAPGRGGPGPGL